MVNSEILSNSSKFLGFQIYRFNDSGFNVQGFNAELRNSQTLKREKDSPLRINLTLIAWDLAFEP